VMSAIEDCRSAVLGGHVERCEDCGHRRIAYNCQRAPKFPQKWALKIPEAGGAVGRAVLVRVVG